MGRGGDREAEPAWRFSPVSGDDEVNQDSEQRSTALVGSQALWRWWWRSRCKAQQTLALWAASSSSAAYLRLFVAPNAVAAALWRCGCCPGAVHLRWEGTMAVLKLLGVWCGLQCPTRYLGTSCGTCAAGVDSPRARVPGMPRHPTPNAAGSLR